jgi:hypothetical protein
MVLLGEMPRYGSGSGYGYGDGYGYGSGDGYGSGSGYGDGYGSGSGSGYGDGYGSGSGYGDGYGSGSGSGSGDGYGSGSGYGSGYGYGSKEYWAAAIDQFVARMPQVAAARAADLRATGAKLAYWRSAKDGSPINGGSGSAVKPGDLQEILGPLELCTHRALHATLLPPKWKGERIWLVALIGEVHEDESKIGALKREIIADITNL